MDEGGRPVRVYRQRMHAVWKERGLQKITEQRLCDQARAIRKNEWFTSVELDQIRRRMTTVDEELMNKRRIILICIIITIIIIII